ncbi:MAG: hypothetical protein E7255_09890 [Lachnospiraceae bacterium]|nr:hypothetical protein [Lachnospiraceae bacterium]
MKRTNDILNNIIGVLEIGLFINLCSRIIVGTENDVETIENNTL